MAWILFKLRKNGIFSEMGPKQIQKHYIDVTVP